MNTPDGTPVQPLLELVTVDNEVRAIEGRIKVRILSLLSERDMSFEEIVSRCDKAKSTISVHLKDLTGAGIIGYRHDPLDGRRKIFYLKSPLLGDATHPDREKFPYDLGLDRELTPDAAPSALLRFIMRTVRVTLLREGVSIDPLLYRAGLEVGRALYPDVTDPDLDLFLAHIAQFWKTWDLGRIEVIGKDPVILHIFDCFECVDLPLMGKPACAFDRGVLSSLFSQWFGDPRVANETRCYAMGNQYCEFQLDVPLWDR